eukprot:TRINITY_DN18783_c0_g1_i3.p2 TRINITY_DN18783_c0_g1~~TRINITY_DN18783_c0_g1_i3.p2  ORF type:complete len:273 (-),score=51.61 TRINITY_DN18783_c0_g1_i3:125-853(-)
MVVRAGIEEPASLKFSVDLLESSSAVPLEGGIPIALANGERYVCSLPQIVEGKALPGATGISQKASQAERAKQAAAVLDKALEKQCFLKLSGWWIYELCHRKYVRQYHQDHRNSVLTEYYLGHGRDSLVSPRKEANLAATGELTFGEDINGVYFSTMFYNGTSCDLTNQERQAEVRYYCSLNSPHPNNYLSVEEGSTCSYIVGFYTQSICYMDEFRILPESTAPINCFHLPKPPTVVYTAFI